MVKKLISIFIFALAALTVSAQDDFDPTLPGEPNAQYKVTVGISIPEAGYVYGGGSFYSGNEVTISKSDAWFSSDADVYYRFLYWTLDGEQYSNESTFTYVVGTENAHFKAVYETLNPDEVTSKVFIEILPADACEYSTTSGQRYFFENYAYIYCEPRPSFEFIGWYEGNKLVSKDLSFNYLVGENDLTLLAKFNYTPSIPSEPVNDGQSDVDNSQKGDVNSDGMVDVQDVVASVNIVLTDAENQRADINKDGVIDVQDVVGLVNIVLKKE